MMLNFFFLILKNSLRFKNAPFSVGVIFKEIQQFVQNKVTSLNPRNKNESIKILLPKFYDIFITSFLVLFQLYESIKPIFLF